MLVVVLMLAACGGATTSNESDVGVGLPYPERSAYRIKGIQPDFWGNPAEISESNAGGIAMNLVWANWEPAKRNPPCGDHEVEWDGHCFMISTATDAAIADWTARGLVVTAIVYGVPEWARTGHACTPMSSGFEIFCSPDDSADFARFAGFIANRYDGLHGHGRIADFVIHNEVNSNIWYDIGCGQGTACDISAWLDAYASDWSAAYDAIHAMQSEAKVLVSLEHHFGMIWDDPSSANPILSGETFLKGFAARVGARKWHVAFHPYPPHLGAPEFSADDWPYVTYGNIGVLAGWLRMHYPATPSAWEIQLTESGVNSLSPQSSQVEQATGICNSFRNILGTPGIESYIYHRMKDHPTETAEGLGLGLHDINGVAKQGWTTWAMANRNDLATVQLSCGFEDLPYSRLTRSSGARGHWASTRLAPSGFTPEVSWLVLRQAESETHLLYECAHGRHNLLTRDVTCEGLQVMGPIGWVWSRAAEGRLPIFRCYVTSTDDHFISPDSGCEGETTQSLLGYALPG